MPNDEVRAAIERAHDQARMARTWRGADIAFFNALANEDAWKAYERILALKGQWVLCNNAYQRIRKDDLRAAPKALAEACK